MKEMRSATCRAIGGPGQGGCISNGQSYLLDGGRKVFVKHNSDPNVSNIMRCTPTGWGNR